MGMTFQVHAMTALTSMQAGALDLGNPAQIGGNGDRQESAETVQKTTHTCTKNHTGQPAPPGGVYVHAYTPILG